MREFSVVRDCQLSAETFWTLKADLDFERWKARQDGQTCQFFQNDVTTNDAGEAVRVDRYYKVISAENPVPKPFRQFLGATENAVHVRCHYHPVIYDAEHPFCYTTVLPVLSDRITINGMQWCEPVSASSCKIHTKHSVNVAIAGIGWSAERFIEGLVTRSIGQLPKRACAYAALKGLLTGSPALAAPAVASNQPNLSYSTPSCEIHAQEVEPGRSATAPRAIHAEVAPLCRSMSRLSEALVRCLLPDIGMRLDEGVRAAAAEQRLTGECNRLRDELHRAGEQLDAARAEATMLGQSLKTTILQLKEQAERRPAERRPPARKVAVMSPPLPDQSKGQPSAIATPVPQNDRTEGAHCTPPLHLSLPPPPRPPDASTPTNPLDERAEEGDRPRAGFTTMGAIESGRMRMQNGCGPAFDLRIGPDYKKHGKKAPSAMHLYEPVSIDVFRRNSIQWHISAGLTLPPPPEGEHVPNTTGMPRRLVINMIVPSEPPSLTGGLPDGRCHQIVVTFRASAAAMQSWTDSGSAASKLFRRFCEHAPEGVLPTAGDVDVKERIKICAVIANMKSLGLGWVERYNGKPALITKSGAVYRGDDYLEICMNTFRFSYLTKRGMASMLDRFKEFELHICVTLEGREDGELPEQALLAVKLKGVDIKNGFHEELDACNAHGV